MKAAKREVLKLENVSKTYEMGKGLLVKALCNVNLSIYEKDFACVLGPSGSGKSTLLHIMGLLDRPTEGKVYIDGKDTTTMDEEEQARVRGQKIGFVFQAYNLVPSLKAWENVALPLIIQGVPASERKERAISILEELGMGGRLEHYPSQLSGGQRQRIAIARALITDPAVMLADEPTGNLDSKSGEEVLAAFKELHNAGRTIVIITHDESITRIAHRIIRIRDGVIIENNSKR